MRKTVIAVVVLFFLGTVQNTLLGQSVATVEGVVREIGTNRPLAGVSIGVTSTGVVPVAYVPAEQRNAPGLAVTDADGRFSVTLNEFGRVRVVPRLEGFIFTRPGQVRAPAQPGVWIQTRAGERITGIELWMTRPATISGRLLDSQGQPIVGSAGSATLYRYTYDASGRRQLGWIPGLTYPGAAGSFVRLDDRGEYRFYDVPPGEYYLGFSGGGQPLGASQTYYYPGVSDEMTAIPLKVGGGQDVRIDTITLPPLQPSQEVRFHLKDAAGASVAARRLYIAGGMLVTAPTRPAEEPILARVAPGRYDVVITNAGILSGDLLYGRANLEVFSSNVALDVLAKVGARVTGSVSIERDERRQPASGVRCRIRSQFGLTDCSKGQVVPGPHDLEFDGMPADAYAISATASGRDIIREGLNIEGDTHLEIVLASPGGIAQGIIRDKDGNTLPAAVVALVPDDPRRHFGPHYRAVISDPNGGFEIHGIAPGRYRLFAWTELEGAAYRSAEFMKEYEERGMPITIEKGGQRVAADLTAY